MSLLAYLFQMLNMEENGLNLLTNNLTMVGEGLAYLKCYHGNKFTMCRSTELSDSKIKTLGVNTMGVRTVAQWVKALLGMPASRFRVPAGVFGAPLPTQLPSQEPAQQWLTPQVSELWPPSWEPQMKFNDLASFWPISGCWIISAAHQWVRIAVSVSATPPFR